MQAKSDEQKVFIDKVDRSIVGDGGFKGEPNINCGIDIGYGIVKSRRRNGYALKQSQNL